ncbi:MAG: FecR family protein, partial [Burkholderiaceae bacterium]|nr:FecR family protein [Burkholderiaceae bacterium]
MRMGLALLMGGVLLQTSACAAPPYDAGPVGSRDGYTVSTQDVDPPGRVGRLSEVLGQVWIYNPEDREWISAERNRPLTTGDRLSTDVLGRAEVRVGSTIVRLDSNSELEVLRLDDDRLELQLHRGAALVRLRD